MTLTCAFVYLFLLPLQRGCWRAGGEEVCVHVTSFHFTDLGFLPRPLPGGEGVFGEACPVLGRLVTGPNPRQTELARVRAP